MQEVEAYFIKNEVQLSKSPRTPLFAELTLLICTRHDIAKRPMQAPLYSARVLAERTQHAVHESSRIHLYTQKNAKQLSHVAFYSTGDVLAQYLQYTVYCKKCCTLGK